MIYIFSKQPESTSQVRQSLMNYGIQVEVAAGISLDQLAPIYQKNIQAVIVDAECELFSGGRWSGFLEEASERIEIFILGANQNDSLFNNNRIHCMSGWDVDKSVDELSQLTREMRGNLGEQIAKYDSPVINSKLKHDGKLSLITVSSSDFKKIRLKYGMSVYLEVQQLFHDLLYQGWGAKGWFREHDLLFQSTDSMDECFIFLTDPRLSQSPLEVPDSLEKLGNRISCKMQEFFWKDFNQPVAERRMPSCIVEFPKISVGYSSVLFNPCFNISDITAKLMSESRESSKVLTKRNMQEQQNTLHSLLHDSKVLTPHYQGIFQLTKETVEAVIQNHHKESKLPYLEDQIVGFESLIRIDQALATKLKQSGDSSFNDFSFFSPKMLFSFAKQNKLTLELDQACLKVAVKDGQGVLPGSIFVNILPRNLYHLEKILSHCFSSGNNDIVFELSESESISNFDLMLEVREKLASLDLRIAADDFGQGHSGFERILKLKPDFLKVDYSLVHQVDKDISKQELLKGVIKGAKRQNCHIVAEGVESLSELRFLHSLGVDCVQGFLLHRPQSRQDILRQIQQEEETIVQDVA